jgi:hypothetical protein
MDEHQAPAGWYPDQEGNQRYWDGAAWTDHTRRPVDATSTAAPVRREGAFSKLRTSASAAQADKAARNKAQAEAEAEAARLAGSLVTSGLFGATTVEIFEGGYVSVSTSHVSSSRSDAASRLARAMTKTPPFERLLSIKYTGPSEEKSSGPSALEGAVGPAVASLVKGGAGLMKATGPGLVAAGVAHVASAGGRKSFLTINTHKQIHTPRTRRTTAS